MLHKRRSDLISKRRARGRHISPAPSDFLIFRSGYERILGTNIFCLSVFPFDPVPRRNSQRHRTEVGQDVSAGSASAALPPGRLSVV